MPRTLTVSLGLLVALPLGLSAQPPANPVPEALLAEDSVFYFRFDGIDAHRAAYDKTVLAELMKGDLGEFLGDVLKLVQEQIGPAVVKNDVLAGRPPETVMRIHKATRQLPVVLDFLVAKGVVLGVEVSSLVPPRGQLIVVLPNGGLGAYPQAFAAGLGFLLERQGFELQESQLAGRKITTARAGADADAPAAAFWVEGPHFVFTFGNEKPERTLARIDKKNGPSLIKSPLYQKVAAFQQYETVGRGFLDVERGVLLAKTLDPRIEKVLTELGVAGIKDIAFYVGFSGRYQRSTVLFNIPGERKGWLRVLTTPGEISLKDLPFLPPDASSVTVARLDAAAAYQMARATTELIAAALPNELGREAKQVFEDFEKKLGVNLKKDLLDNLEPTVVFYNSFGEGPVFLGSAVAFKLKDEKKAADAVRTIAQSLPAAFDTNVIVKRIRYQDVDIFTLHIGDRGNPITPSYVIHRGWLVIGLMPSASRGFVLRATGKYKSWQPSAMVSESLEEFRKGTKCRLIAFSESDPREPLRLAASFGQLFIGLLDAFSEFNVGKLSVPHFQALTEPLTPSVIAVLDEGTTIRIESKGTLMLLTDLIGLDSALLLFVLSLGF